jgi:hypothetical protein
MISVNYGRYLFKILIPLSFQLKSLWYMLLVLCLNLLSLSEMKSFLSLPKDYWNLMLILKFLIKILDIYFCHYLNSDKITHYFYKQTNYLHPNYLKCYHHHCSQNYPFVIFI